MQFITVTALNKYVKTVLDADVVVSNIVVLGEISSFVQNAASGHCYFSLADSQSTVKAVMFKSSADRLAFIPENGLSVLARGRATLYEKGGTFQLNVDDMQLYGEGDRHAQLEALRHRLNKEGLFDEQHKKTLPRFTKKIAVVTSGSGAAFHDITNVISRRWPCVKLLLIPVSVQGAAAEAELLDAVLSLDELGCDCAIIARGGGSKEDLDAFNSEALVRAVYACRTPVISAVGHEIDFSLLDFAADVRAPTPSAAAELAVPDSAEYLYSVNSLVSSCASKLAHRTELAQSRLSAATRFSRSPLVQLESIARNANLLWDSINTAACGKLNEFTNKTQTLFTLISKTSPQTILDNGYAIVENNGKRVLSGLTLRTGDEIGLIMADARLECTLNKKEPRGNEN